MRTARPVDQTGHPLGVEPGHPPVRALTGHAQLPGDVGDRATVHPNPLDQQPPAMDRQASVSVRHEDLRSVETSDISTTPEVLPSRQQPSPTSWPSTSSQPRPPASAATARGPLTVGRDYTCSPGSRGTEAVTTVPSGRIVSRRAAGSGTPSIRGPCPSSATVAGVPGTTTTCCPRTLTVSPVPAATLNSIASARAVTRRRVPRTVIRNVRDCHAAGRRGSNVISPSWWRMPPKPLASALHTPAAEATCTPSAVLWWRSARSKNSASSKWRSDSLWYPTSAATIDCTTADRLESPVVIGS